MANPFDDKVVADMRRKKMEKQEAKEKYEAEKLRLWELENEGKIAAEQQRKIASFAKYIQDSLVREGKAYVTCINDLRYVIGWKTAQNCYGGLRGELSVANFKSIERDLRAAGYEFYECSKDRLYKDDGPYGDDGTTINAQVILIKKP